MSSFVKNHSFIYSFYCIICVLPFVISIPVITKDDPFDKFIEFLSINNCSMPKEVELPFSVTDSVPFSYLSFPLKECKSSEAVKENNEATLLCREIFEVIQNITCNDYKLNNSKIDSSKLSTDICKGFAAIQDVIPKQNEFLSRKFGDSIICRVLCTGKYEFLCKTLLWGYNTQAKLKDATLGKNVAVQGEENLVTHPDNNEIPDEEIVSNLEKQKQILKEDTNVNNATLDAKLKTPTADKTSKIESTLSAIEDKKKETKNYEDEKTKKIDTQKSDKPIKESKVIVIQPDKVASKSSNDLSEQNQTIMDDKNNDLNENNIETQSKSSSKTNKVDVPTIDVNISASDDKDVEKVDVDIPIQGADNKVDITDNNEKIINVPNPTVPKTEEEEDLKKSGQEIVKQDETKETQANSISKQEDPKENEIPNEEGNSNLAEPTVPSIFPDKSEDFERQPELKDPEQYNTAFNPALKKESNVKNTLNDGSSQFSSGSKVQISNENFLEHESDINRNFLPAHNYLPDQEDSHFFFYFLTIVLVLMVGYLIFHNKQKIIALIVEGRHERRRRSHGAGYKKLETK